MSFRVRPQPRTQAHPATAADAARSGARKRSPRSTAVTAFRVGVAVSTLVRLYSESGNSAMGLSVLDMASIVKRSPSHIQRVCLTLIRARALRRQPVGNYYVYSLRTPPGVPDVR